MRVPIAPADEAFGRGRRFTSAARTGFEHLLLCLKAKGGAILLPNYIGQSPLEGSGIFDPVRASGVDYAFYDTMGEALSVRLESLERELAARPTFAVFVVHYFGMPQPSMEAIRALCAQHKTALIEDCAHVLDLPDSPLGLSGQYALYSLHKMLPCKGGGILQVNPGAIDPGPVPERWRIDRDDLEVLANADIAAIAKARRHNATILASELQARARIHPFWPTLPDDCVPVAYPVRLAPGVDRFAVYRELRAQGFGVVALYHTLIDALSARVHVESHALSRSIIHLPIHQDVDAASLAAMADTLVRAAETCDGG